MKELHTTVRDAADWLNNHNGADVDKVAARIASPGEVAP